MSYALKLIGKHKQLSDEIPFISISSQIHVKSHFNLFHFCFNFLFFFVFCCFPFDTFLAQWILRSIKSYKAFVKSHKKNYKVFYVRFRTAKRIWSSKRALLNHWNTSVVHRGYGLSKIPLHICLFDLVYWHDISHFSLCFHSFAVRKV